MFLLVNNSNEVPKMNRFRVIGPIKWLKNLPAKGGRVPITAISEKCSRVPEWHPTDPKNMGIPLSETEIKPLLRRKTRLSQKWGSSTIGRVFCFKLFL